MHKGRLDLPNGEPASAVRQCLMCGSMFLTAEADLMKHVALSFFMPSQLLNDCSKWRLFTLVGLG